jgi:hypothetical protein
MPLTGPVVLLATTVKSGQKRRSYTNNPHSATPIHHPYTLTAREFSRTCASACGCSPSGVYGSCMHEKTCRNKCIAGTSVCMEDVQERVYAWRTCRNKCMHRKHAGRSVLQEQVYAWRTCRNKCMHGGHAGTKRTCRNKVAVHTKWTPT